MRISIWQQFSSNHSASYTVVGKFSDPASAQNAAQELNNILQQLKSWWDKQLAASTAMEWHDIFETGGMTPLEEAFSQHYDVDWKGINWYYWKWGDETNIPVVTLNEFVFVRSPHYHIWYGPQPFDGLLKRLGGEVWVESSESRSHADTGIDLLIESDAPDETIAQKIEEECLKYITAINSDDETGIPPWLGCYDGSCAPDSDDLKFHVAIYFSESKSNSVGWKLYCDINLAHLTSRDEKAARLRQQYIELYLSGQIHLTLEQMQRAYNAFYTTTHAIDFGHQEIRRTGIHVELQGFRFDVHLPNPLMAVIAWLESLGCKNTQFSFTEIARPNSDD
jgi:hypothetical protein